MADNASSDNSIEILKSEFPEVRIIVLDRNYGFAGGYNHALKQVSTPYYMLLNSDVEVGENWLGPLVDFMDAHPEAAACQPKLLAEHTRDHFEYAGASGGYIDRYGYPYCRGRVFETVEKDEGQYDDIVEVADSTSASLHTTRRLTSAGDSTTSEGEFSACRNAMSIMSEAAHCQKEIP